MTKIRKSVKILIMLAVTLFAICMFGTTKVEASIGVITSGTPTKNALDNISSTINLDMKTTNLENLENQIYNQILNELKANGMTIENKEYSSTDILLIVNITIPMNEKEDLYIEKILVQLWDNAKQDNLAQKEISINWSNKTNYNENDKQYIDNLIKNLNLPKNVNGKYEFCKKVELGQEIGSRVEYAIETLKKQISDNSIALIHNGSGSGGAGPLSLTGGGEIGISIFKDGVFYKMISPSSYFQYKITIPGNIEDTDKAYIDYSLPKIKSYVGTSEKLNVEKISGYYYKVFLDNDKNNYDEIVIKKAEGTPVGNNIFVNNINEGINIVATVKNNETMETELKNKGYTNILGSYELTLQGATKLSSPVDITFNVGAEHNNKVVYILHQKKDGTYENFEKNVVNGKVTITVSELSPFVLGLKEDKSNNEETSNTNNIISNNSDNTNKLDETPKTGNIEIVSILSLLAVISLTGILAIKYNKK